MSRLQVFLKYFFYSISFNFIFFHNISFNFIFFFRFYFLRLLSFSSYSDFSKNFTVYYLLDNSKDLADTSFRHMLSSLTNHALALPISDKAQFSLYLYSSRLHPISELENLQSIEELMDKVGNIDGFTKNLVAASSRNIFTTLEELLTKIRDESDDMTGKVIVAFVGGNINDDFNTQALTERLSAQKIQLALVGFKDQLSLSKALKYTTKQNIVIVGSAGFDTTTNVISRAIGEAIAQQFGKSVNITFV